MSEAKQSPSRIFFEEKDEALTQLIPKFALANLMRSRIKPIEQNKTLSVIGDDA